jgi:hypothetical protein
MYCFKENENYDIILQNKESHDNDNIQTIKITREAEKYIDQLKLYFIQNENKSAQTSLDVCTDFVNKQSFN